MTSGTYAIKNKSDGKMYFGSSKNIEKKFIAVIVCVFVLIAIVSCGISINQNWDALSNPEPLPLATPAEQANVMLGLQVAGVLVALLFVGWVIKSIARSGYGLPVFFSVVAILIIGVVAGLYVYGDKNNDGVADVMVIRVVQPTGNDAATDSTYALVNRDNSSSNIANAGAFSIYAGVIWVVILSAFFCSLILYYRKRV